MQPETAETHWQQPQLGGLRALVEVNGVGLLPMGEVTRLPDLSTALHVSRSQRITHRDRTVEDWADDMGQSKGDFSKKTNGANLPQTWLTRYARVTGNALPLQWLAAQLGFKLVPMEW